jgi:CAAX protease family protein
VETLVVSSMLPDRPAPLASWRHTAVLITIFLGLAVGGARFQRGHGLHTPPAASHARVVPIYLSLLVAQWGLFLYVWRGALKGSTPALRELIGGRWRRVRDVAFDLGAGLAFWGAWGLISAAWNRALGHGPARSVDALLPHGPIEASLWVALSLSAGFNEELVFRGYFRRQFEAWTGSGWIAWALQAVLFGIGHGYQGAMACLKITVYGALVGLLATWRRSLRPGMVAHAWTDIAAGLLRV